MELRVGQMVRFPWGTNNFRLAEVVEVWPHNDVRIRFLDEDEDIRYIVVGIDVLEPSDA